MEQALAAPVRAKCPDLSYTRKGHLIDPGEPKGPDLPLMGKGPLVDPDPERLRAFFRYAKGNHHYRKQMSMRLSRAAHKTLIKNLETYGNVLTKAHKAALARLLRDMSEAAFGLRSGRTGYPLPAGAGKSQAAVTWAWASWNYGTGLSCVIASSRIENLGELRDALCGLGVPEDLIGIFHKDPAHRVKATEGNEARPILLVTQAQLRQGQPNMAEYAFYEGRKRDLFVWDESLIAEDHLSVSLASLAFCLGGLKEQHSVTGEGQDATTQNALRYLDICKDRIVAEMASQDDLSP